jgi:hypothetical protein
MGFQIRKIICFWLMTVSMAILLVSCSGNGGQDDPVPKNIRLYPYGKEIPYDISGGTISVSRYIEIRVFDNLGQSMPGADLLVSVDSGVTYQALSKNTDGKWVVDPTGKTFLYARAGDVAVHVGLNTDDLIKMDTESSLSFNGQEPPEYQGPFHDQGVLLLTPNTLLSPSVVPANLCHVLYQVDWQDTRTEISRVFYGQNFALNLADFSNVTAVTTCVFKNTLAIIENNRIVYETGLCRVATIIFYY